ncbi:hypothetical protein N510_000040 [Firmicutes bacterium ASF500]|nr:hypothetical protein N510_000040 [Firmicutes bacterium ASF500]
MYYILEYYKYALIGISVLLLAGGSLAILGRFQRGGVKGLALEYRNFQGKWSMVPLVLAVLMLNLFLIPAGERLHTSAGITLNYHLASQGLNPNGTRFNQTHILSTQVLERAVERGALEGVTAADLKRTLQVRPAVQGSSASEASYFISSQFVLEYNADRNTVGQDGEKLLTLVTQEYQKWFIKEYSANTDILKLDFSPAEGQDYLDQSSFLKKTAESIGEYMRNMSSEEAAFRSSVNGETFQSMSAKAYAVSNTLVEDLDAYILENGVSVDAEQYIDRLSVANVFLDFDARKASASNENTLEAVALYADDMARIVLVPTYDTGEQFYMSQTRIGVDDFAASADSYANKKTELNEKMAKNRHVITQFSGRGGRGTDKKAETLVDQIQQELLRVAEQAKELVEEYNAQQANSYMTVVVYALEDRVKRLVIKIAALTALFAVGAQVSWFAMGGRRKGARMA